MSWTMVIIRETLRLVFNETLHVTVIMPEVGRAPDINLQTRLRLFLAAFTTFTVLYVQYIQYIHKCTYCMYVCMICTYV